MLDFPQLCPVLSSCSDQRHHHTTDVEEIFRSFKNVLENNEQRYLFPFLWLCRLSSLHRAYCYMFVVKIQQLAWFTAHKVVDDWVDCAVEITKSVCDQRKGNADVVAHADLRISTQVKTTRNASSSPSQRWAKEEEKENERFRIDSLSPLGGAHPLLRLFEQAMVGPN